MANEIIVLERNNGSYSFLFYYPIAPASRIEIGGTGTTGKYPVETPSDSLGSVAQLRYTQAEKDALDAGEAQAVPFTIGIPEGASDGDVLGWAQATYAANTASALAAYQRRYKYIGRRFDA